MRIDYWYFHISLVGSDLKLYLANYCKYISVCRHIPLWPSECFCRSFGSCQAGCWSGPSPAPAPCSCSGCSWSESGSLQPPSQSLQAACWGCQLPLQRPCHLRIWHLRLKSGTDQRHRATENWWEGKAGCRVLIAHNFGGKITICCLWLVKLCILF